MEHLTLPPWKRGAQAAQPPVGFKTTAEKAIGFLTTLKIPEGPKAGQPLTLAPFQEHFVNGALDDAINVAALSIGRGNAKTALSSGIALGALLGIWDDQPRREILLAARSRDQAAIAWNFVAGFAEALSEDVRGKLVFRRAPRLEIEYRTENGPHLLRAISADGKTALGTAPTLVLMDERGHWPLDRGDDLEHALLSGLGKRGGKGLIISTSASTDTHPFSVWLDNPSRASSFRNIGHHPAFLWTISKACGLRTRALNAASGPAWNGYKGRRNVPLHAAAPP